MTCWSVLATPKRAAAAATRAWRTGSVSPGRGGVAKIFSHLGSRPATVALPGIISLAKRAFDP